MRRNPEAALEAEVLLAAVLGKTREWLYANGDELLPRDREETYRGMVERRAEKRCPVAYLTGRREFAGLDLLMRPGVFIPRPETEGLVELAATLLRPYLPLADDEVIVDACCGTGAIGIALASMIGARIVGCDISPEAVEVANRNATRCGVERLFHALEGSFLEPLRRSPRLGRIAAIVANPPYVRRADLAKLERDVADFEPMRALDGGDDGLAAIRELEGEARRMTRAGRLFALEIGSEQAAAMKELLRDPTWEQADIKPDLSGLPRYAVAIRAEER